MKPQLFMLHFAGGNCYSFNRIAPCLKDFEVIQLELPGRGKRVRENLLIDFNLAANDFFQQIMEKLSSQTFIIYGHSMGAYLALRVSNMLEKCKKFPHYLFVSGNPGPGIPRNKDKHTMKHDEFIEAIRQMGGVSTDFMENEELLQFFVPILRADFTIVERNDLTHEPPVRAPLFAMMGTAEEGVESICNWSRFTRSRFNYEILEGGHFFIHTRPKEIANIIHHTFYNSFSEPADKPSVSSLAF